MTDPRLEVVDLREITCLCDRKQRRTTVDVMMEELEYCLGCGWSQVPNWLMAVWTRCGDHKAVTYAEEYNSRSMS